MMKNIWGNIALLTGLIVALTEYGSVVNTQAADSQTEPRNPIFKTPLLNEEPQKEDTHMTQTAPPLSSSGLEDLIEKAKTKLGERLSIAKTQIILTEAKEVVWPDSSLGCPQSGMKYKQVPEDGALIVLEAQRKVYEYHSGGVRGLFLCKKGLSKPEKPLQIDITNLTPQMIDKDNPLPSVSGQGIPPGEDQ